MQALIAAFFRDRASPLVSSSIVIVVLPGGRKMAGQSDRSRQAEKGRAEDGREHHLSPVYAKSPI